MIQIELKTLKIKDLNNQEYEINLQKDISNLIFIHADTIELDTISRKIHETGESSVTAEDIDKIIKIIEAYPIYLPFIQRNLITYLKNKL